MSRLEQVAHRADELGADNDLRAAFEGTVKALRRAVDDRNFWRELASQADGRRPTELTDPSAFLQMIGRILGNAYAELLEQVGYENPPPPPAYELVEQTRRAVMWGDRTPRWGKHHVQKAHDELHAFVARLDVALADNARGKLPVRTLRNLAYRTRRVSFTGLLLLALTHAEVKAGDDFGIEVAVSFKDKVKFEITAPFSLVSNVTGVEILRAVVINSQVASLGETLDIVQFSEQQGVGERGPRWYDGEPPQASAARSSDDPTGPRQAPPPGVTRTGASNLVSVKDLRGEIEFAIGRAYRSLAALSRARATLEVAHEELSYTKGTSANLMLAQSVGLLESSVDNLVDVALHIRTTIVILEKMAEEL